MGEGQGATSVAAMVDAQFGNIKVLLPYANFEDDYQARGGASMIAFPGGRDPNAEAQKAGYDVDLQLGMPVPRGSRVSLGIPLAVDTQSEIVLYRYFIVFRDRNLRDHRDPGGGRTRPPFHYARQGPGATDNSLGVPATRFPVDARYHNLGYEQLEPVLPGPAGMATLNLYPEAFIPTRVIFPNALLPGGQFAATQQGIYDPAQVPSARQVMRAEVQVDANGDDIIVFAQKIPNSQGVFANWDFDNADQAFSNVFGRGNFTPPALHGVYTDGGIRLTTGSNP